MKTLKTTHVSDLSKVTQLDKGRAMTHIFSMPFRESNILET